MSVTGKQSLNQRARVLELLREGRELYPKEGYPKAFNDRHAHYVWGLTQGLSYAEAMQLVGYAYETAKKLQETRAVEYARMQFRRERATEVRTMMEDRALSMAEDMIKLLKPKDLLPITEKHSTVPEESGEADWMLQDTAPAHEGHTDKLSSTQSTPDRTTSAGPDFLASLSTPH